MTDRSRALLAVGFGLLLALPAQAGTWRVGCSPSACSPPCNFSGSSGIADCMISLEVLPGDTVMVWPCTYSSKIPLKSGIFLVSHDGPESTFLQGSASGEPAVFMVGTSPFTGLQGFTITWDAGTNSSGGGVAAYVSSGTIRNNIFVSNNAAVGSGIYLQASDVLIENNLFVTNNCNAGGGTAAISGGTPTFRNNTFSGNFAPFGYEGAAVYATGSDFTFERNIVHGSDGAPAVFCGGGNLPSISCNVFWDNELGAFAGQCADSVGTSNNVAADPLFCNSGGGDFGFCSDSPALTGPCGIIGYTSPGGNCGPCRPTAAAALEFVDWGRLKTLYR